MTQASKVLVLGGTRFVGLRLVHHLHGQGHDVTVLNRGQTEASLPEGVTRLRADRADPSQVVSVLAGKEYDAVFDISGYQPADVQPVIESMEGKVGHYVFCSSVAVYAPWDTVPIREDHPSKDASGADGYSAGKVRCEDILMEAFAKRGFPVSVVRLPIVYGPHNHIWNREPGIFARIRERRNIFIAGEGLSLLHPVHVDDLAAAFAAIPGRKETLGQAYNAVSPDAATENGLVNIIAEGHGRRGRNCACRPAAIRRCCRGFRCVCRFRSVRPLPVWHESFLQRRKAATRHGLGAKLRPAGRHGDDISVVVGTRDGRRGQGLLGR